MKNSIFKSYAKKILKSQAFVSVIIVFVLSLGIIGTSYSLYMDVDTDTDYQIVKSGDLSIDFTEGSSKITLTSTTPMDDTTAINQTNNVYQFTVYNNGTYAVDYSVSLIPNSSNTVKPEYINYRLCVGKTNESSNCGEVQTLSNKVDYVLYNDNLSNNGDSTIYYLKIWVNDNYPTTETSTKAINLNVGVEAKNVKGELTNTNTLGGKILNDSRITINKDVPDFSKVETTEKGIYKAEDDYGTTYYFRGKQSYNYVSFADKIWRIVRINGDGSIRLILYGAAKNTDGEYISTNFNDVSNDNAYIGYMYGMTGQTSSNTNQCIKLNSAGTAAEVDTTITTEDACISAGGKWAATPYDATHVNVVDSTLKTEVDVWYENNLKTEFSSYLADTLFCEDKTLADKSIASDNTALGYGTNKTYYKSYQKYFLSNTTLKPTFKCAENVSNAYSRYTVDVNTLVDGYKTNGDLKYPIGLFSVDEYVLAGAAKVMNGYFYLIDDDDYHNVAAFEMISPSQFNGTNSVIISGNYNNGIFNQSSTKNTRNVRPVINLKADVMIDSGDGTSSNPYTLKLQ